LQCPLDVALRVARLGHAGDADVPEIAVGCGPLQAGEMADPQRFEADPVVLESDRRDRLHQRL
jgi:hypothetical protein